MSKIYTVTTFLFLLVFSGLLYSFALNELTIRYPENFCIEKMSPFLLNQAVILCEKTSNETIPIRQFKSNPDPEKVLLLFGDEKGFTVYSLKEESTKEGQIVNSGLSIN